MHLLLTEGFRAAVAAGQLPRVLGPQATAGAPPRAAAGGPRAKQVWSWDITDRPTSVRRVWPVLYLVIDFSGRGGRGVPRPQRTPRTLGNGPFRLCQLAVRLWMITCVDFDLCCCNEAPGRIPLKPGCLSRERFQPSCGGLKNHEHGAMPPHQALGAEGVLDNLSGLSSSTSSTPRTMFMPQWKG